MGHEIVTLTREKKYFSKISFLLATEGVFAKMFTTLNTFDILKIILIFLQGSLRVF